MHQIKPYETGVTLFHINGSAERYASKSQALKALGWKFICNQVGENFRSFRALEYYHNTATGSPQFNRLYDQHSFIMRDDAGNALGADDFRLLKWKPFVSSNWYNQNYAGKGSPVPHTGVGNRGWSYRKIRTTKNRRWAQIVEDVEVRPRPGCGVNGLPNSWDDIARMDRNDRSWKHNRKTQYKPQRPAKGLV